MFIVLFLKSTYKELLDKEYDRQIVTYRVFICGRGRKPLLLYYIEPFCHVSN